MSSVQVFGAWVFRSSGLPFLNTSAPEHHNTHNTNAKSKPHGSDCLAKNGRHAFVR